MDKLTDLHTEDRRPLPGHKEGKAMRLRIADGRGELWLEFPEHASVNVGQALQSVKHKSPEAYKRWYDSQGRLRGSLAIFVNGEHIRYRGDMKTQLSYGDELYIIPMIAGG
jgi:molybdopterin converting factor small subunit